MTTVKTNGTAVTVAEKANEVVTAQVVNKPQDIAKKAVNIASDLIEPSNYNARKTFDAESLGELAQSISVHGLIQPITVRRRGEKTEKYEIICGERRFRACRMLHITEIPCIIREATDEQAYDLSIIENLQREDVPPMEAAEAYKRLIDTKRYDIASLAVQYGKSEKHIYQMLKLCDLIKGIADLVRTGKLSASAGIVVSKYNRKMQADILKDRFGEDGQGEWCHLSAGALENKVQSYYTNDLGNYHFDKTKCLKCAHNSTNFDLFAEGSGCGRCTNRTCLTDKQTAHIVAEAKAVATKDPKLVFIGDQYSRGCEAKQIIQNGGYEFKNVQTYNLNRYPTAPTAPQATQYKKTEDFDKAQEKYNKEQQRYEKKTEELETLKEEGKIRVFADISRDAVTLHYKEVATKDSKTNEQLIADLTARKERNDELRDEKSAEGVKELLRTDELPQSAFTQDEEAAVYFFMLSKLRRDHYTAVGLKKDDYYRNLTDGKKLEIARSLTEEQKTIVRRDYLYSHLTDGTKTIGDEKGGMLLAFARQHLPEKTEEIINAQAEEYGRKNARLNERIAGLKEAEKKAKADTKAKKQGEAAKAKKSAKTDGKAVAEAKKADAPTLPKEEVKAQAKDASKAESTTPKTVNTAPTGKTEEQRKTTPKAEPKKEAKNPQIADKVLIVGVPKRQPKTEAVAV